MRDSRAALRYAKAILDLAKDSKIESKVNEDMMLVSSTISENHDLAVMLRSPIIKAKAKQNVLNTLFENKVNELTLGVFHLLLENKRLDILYPVAKQYTIIYDYLKSIEIAKVITAVPITKEIEDQVLAKILKLTGHDATIENIVNPAILGGFILRVGDIQYDASISNHLNKLKKEFDNSHFIPKI
ncbi:MAG: ATP synthase F1 subunit delta [Polaribacter sp.]|nr:ATP synthase F1 subunit delta [Polaribacter sp.]